VHCVLYATVREDPPRTLAPIIGDAIHNMRSALDYLAYELASPKARKSRSTQFPICMDESQFRHPDNLRKIASITGDGRDLIERLQPYNATDPPRHNPLAILNKLSNRDKHRLLVPCVAAVNTAESWVASDNAEVNFEFIEPGPVTHDARIVALTARPRNPSTEMILHPRSGLHIATEHGRRRPPLGSGRALGDDPLLPAADSDRPVVQVRADAAHVAEVQALQ
jgi:hypothetical protein